MSSPARLVEPAKGPRVSVLMSVYQVSQYIEEAIQSILDQTFSDFELVIISDGADAETLAIIRSFSDSRIRLFENESNKGLTASLQIGLEYCRGEFIARMDGDDISERTRLAEEVQFLEKHPEAAIVGSDAWGITSQGKIHLEINLPHTPTEIRWHLLFENCFIHSAMMFRRKLILDEFGGYNSNFKRTQDYELWSRVARRYPPWNLSKKLLRWRQHNDSISAKQPREASLYSRQIAEENFKHLQLPAHLFESVVAIREPYDPERKKIYSLLLKDFDLLHSSFAKSYQDSDSESLRRAKTETLTRFLELVCGKDADLSWQGLRQLFKLRGLSAVGFIRPKWIAKILMSYFQNPPLNQ